MLAITPYLGDLGQLRTPKEPRSPLFSGAEHHAGGAQSIERQSGTELVLLTLDAFLLSVVIPVSFFYMKNAPVNHDGTHFLNSILCFAQQIFIKCSPSLCDGEQAPDKQIEKRHALWPKFQASGGFRQAVEEHIGLIPKKKNAQTEHTLQKRT